MNGLFGHPQLEVALESIIAVCWYVAFGDGTFTFVIVPAASTHAISGVSLVNLVLTLCLSTGVLVPCCQLDAALDPITSHSVVLFFSALLSFPIFCYTTVAVCLYSSQGGSNCHPFVQ